MPEPQTPAVEGSHEPGTIPANPPRNVDWTKLDALLEGLPPGIPILPPEDAGNFEKYTHRPRHVYAPGDGWKNCARVLEKFDVELCKGYREEIDTLLVFAGLFSAVVTAFTIESYQWLQADPNNTMIVLLSQIAQSVSRNNTVAPPFPAAAGLPGPVAVRINGYWFLALALSLSAALVAILCKQWIREFERNTGLSPKLFVGIHQTKLEGLEKGKVGGIISLLPLLLQLALALFALGVLELLWKLHSAIAAVVCVPTIVASLFYVATTVLPVLSFNRGRATDCPYKSPQAKLAFLAYDFWTWMRYTFTYGLYCLAHLCSLIKHYLTVPFSARDVPFPSFERRVVSWFKFDAPKWHALSLDMNGWLDDEDSDVKPLSVYRGLRWMHRNLDDGDITQWIWHCLWETALVPDSYVPGGEEATKRGFGHVDDGAADVPQSGLCALALSYLMQTPSHSSFLVEAVIQNLSDMDAASAEYLMGRLVQQLITNYLDAQAVVAILKAAGAYGRLHLQKPIGGFLATVAGLAIRIAPSDRHLCRVVLGYTTLLYHTWLGMQPMPYQPSTVQSNEGLVWFNCLMLTQDPDDYGSHPDRLRLRPAVQELAELFSIFAQSHEDPAAALSTTMPSHYRAEIRPIVQALLEIARSDQDSAAAGGDGALVVDTALSPPTPNAAPPPGPTPSSVQSEATEGDPTSAPSPRRHSTRQAQSPDPQPSCSPELGESVGLERERHGVSGSSQLRGSPALRADAAHAPSARHVQTRPSGNSANSVRCADGEEDREASRSTGGTDPALSRGEEADSEGAPDDSGSPASASLRAVIIHSPSHAGARESAGNQDEIITPLVPGEDRESCRDHHRMDASVLHRM